MREMSSLDVMFFMNELKLMIDGRIQKIYQNDKRIRIEIFCPGKGTFELYFEPGMMFISEYKRKFDEPGNFAMFLRKHVQNEKIVNIRQKDFDRIVEIETESYILILEAFSKGNAILCYKDYKILMALQNQEWKHRTIRPGLKYEYPPSVKNPFTISFDDFQNMINEREIVRFLATDMSLSGIYAEEVCIRAKVEKTKIGNQLSHEEAERLFKHMQHLKDEFGPQLVIDNDKIIDAVPFDMKFYEGKEVLRTTTFTHALDEFYSKAEEIRSEVEQGSKTEKKLDKLRNMADAQKNQIERLEIEEKVVREQAEKTFNNIDKINIIIHEMEKMKKEKISWNEIKERMKDKIKLIDEKKGKIILDL